MSTTHIKLNRKGYYLLFRINSLRPKDIISGVAYPIPRLFVALKSGSFTRIPSSPVITSNLSKRSFSKINKGLFSWKTTVKNNIWNIMRLHQFQVGDISVSCLRRMELTERMLHASRNILDTWAQF
jgi:hypothetical protein